MYGYSQTRAFPEKDYEALELSSKSESYSVFMYQDLFQKDEYKGEFSAGIEKSMKRVVQGCSSRIPDRGNRRDQKTV